MRSLRLILVVVCLVITGCAHEEVKVTSASIQDAFEKVGISLSEKTDINPKAVFSHAYNDVTPERFIIDDNQSISIYIYSSSKEAKKGLKDFESMWATADIVQHSKYLVSNALLFYVADDAFIDDRVEMAIKELQSRTRPD